MIREIETSIGTQRLGLVHLNDSKTEFGSGSDRHCHIGKGGIGVDGLRRIMNHKCLRGLPAVMETPRESDADDRANMRRARELMKRKRSAR